MILSDDIEQVIKAYADRESEVLAFPAEWKEELKEMLESAVLSGMNLISAHQSVKCVPPKQLRKVIAKIAYKRGWDHVQLLPDDG